MFELFQYDFMVRAFIAGIIISVIAPMIGMFLVVRRYSLMADTLSHVSLVGVAAAIFLKINPIVGALFASVLASIGMEQLRTSKKIYGESVLALFLSGSLSIAIVIISLANGLNVNFIAYLFGSITTVSSFDIYLISVLGLFVFIMIVILFKYLFLVSYDEELAKANGIKVKLLNIFLIILAAMTVSVSMQIVGILLVGALMVIPVMTSTQYKLSFKKTMILAIAFSLASVIVGLYSSYYLNLASGGTIVITSLLFFIVSLFINRGK